MASEWIETQLQEIASDSNRAFAMGPFGSNIKAENYRESGVPIIRGTNLGECGDAPFIHRDFVFLTEDKANELASSSAAPNDIVFVAQGTVGKVGIIPINTPYRRFVLSQNLMKVTINPERADPHFVFYFYRSNFGQHEIMSRVNPTGVPCISQPLTSLRNFGVRLPSDVNEQRAVGRILSTLDDKIELNRLVNESLEAIVRALFRSWFVDFDPVHAKAEGRDPGLPNHLADMFPDSFEDSELGGIPKGWRVGNLGEVAENPRRAVQASAIDVLGSYIGLEHMPRRSIALSEWLSADNLESNKFEFRKGEILFGKLRPYFHKVGVAPVDGVCSTDILVVTSKKPEWFGFVLGHISSISFVEYVTASSTGTKMPRTNWQDMSRYSIAIPTETTAARFTQLTRNLVERIIESIHQSRTLAALRDTLLPKLISGELRLSDAERIVRGQV